MSFARVFLKTVPQILITGSPERAFRKARDLKLDPRIEQLWLALSSLAFASCFLIYLLVPLAGPLLSSFSIISSGDSPSFLAFWLSENNWLGLGVGAVLGILLQGTLRHPGFNFLTAAGLLLTGISSLGTAWGIFLGGWICGSAQNFWNFPQKEFRLRSGISLAFGLAGLIGAPLLLVLTTLLFLGEYSAQSRWVQWLLLTSLFLAMETFVSLIFFHFYYRKSLQLTKV